MSRNKNKNESDLGGASTALLDADTVAELKELISKLASSNDVVDALEQGELSSMVTFLESFQSSSAEGKFILHHLTKAVTENNPDRLLRWALVYMLRNSKTPPDRLQLEVLKLLPAGLH